MRLAMERLEIQRRHAKYDPCEAAGCAGMLTVDTTVINEEQGTRTQYLCCNVCRWTPADNKLTVPLAAAPPRKKTG